MEAEYVTEKVDDIGYKKTEYGHYDEKASDKDLEPVDIHASEEEDSPIEEVRSVVPK
jgi:hypothetical protein